MATCINNKDRMIWIIDMAKSIIVYLLTPIPNFYPPVPRIILIVINIVLIKYVIIPYGWTDIDIYNETDSRWKNDRRKRKRQYYQKDR